MTAVVTAGRAAADLTKPEGASQWLKQQCGLSAKWETEWTSGGTQIKALTVIGDSETRAKARSELAALERPADPRSLVAALAECSVLCARRADGDPVNEIALKAFASRLSEFPADVALAAVRAWPDKNKWFPTWAELRAECKALMAPRIYLARDLDDERWCMVGADYFDRGYWSSYDGPEPGRPGSRFPEYLLEKAREEGARKRNERMERERKMVVRS